MLKTLYYSTQVAAIIFQVVVGYKTYFSLRIIYGMVAISAQAATFEPHHSHIVAHQTLRHLCISRIAQLPRHQIAHIFASGYKHFCHSVYAVVNGTYEYLKFHILPSISCSKIPHGAAPPPYNHCAAPQIRDFHGSFAAIDACSALSTRVWHLYHLPLSATH